MSSHIYKDQNRCCKTSTEMIDGYASPPRTTVPRSRSPVPSINRETRLKIRAGTKGTQATGRERPCPRSESAGAVGNQPAPLRVTLGEAAVLPSKDSTSCCSSSCPNRLRRDLRCIITTCKDLNIWCRSLITVSIFHSVVSDGIFVAILQPQRIGSRCQHAEHCRA